MANHRSKRHVLWCFPKRLQNHKLSILISYEFWYVVMVIWNLYCLYGEVNSFSQYIRLYTREYGNKKLDVYLKYCLAYLPINSCLGQIDDEQELIIDIDRVGLIWQFGYIPFMIYGIFINYLEIQCIVCSFEKSLLVKHYLNSFSFIVSRVISFYGIWFSLYL